MAKAQCNKRYRSGMNKFRVSALVFISTGIFTLLSFISIPLSIMVFAGFASALMMMNEHQRRKNWEKANSFKFKVLQSSVQDLQHESQQQKIDIAEIRRELKEQQQNRQPIPFSFFNDERKKPANAYQIPRAKKSDFMLEHGIETRSASNKLMPHISKIRKEREDKKPAIHNKSAHIYQDNNYNAEDYASLSDSVIEELVAHALTNKRMQVFVQPIMRLPQRKVRFYELYARLRAKPGLYIPAARYMPIAEQNKIKGRIDELVLMESLRTIEESAHLERAAPFFINITKDTIKNATFMKKLLPFLSKNKHLSSRLIFEMAHIDFESLTPSMYKIVEGLGKIGCAFSIDHVDHLSFDLSLMRRMNVKFVKVKPSLALKKQDQMARCKNGMEALGISIIFEQIESEETLRQILNFEPQYAQGYLFGKPDLQGAFKTRVRAKRNGIREQFG